MQRVDDHTRIDVGSNLVAVLLVPYRTARAVALRSYNFRNNCNVNRPTSLLKATTRQLSPGEDW
jgi:hypothetical protein